VVDVSYVIADPELMTSAASDLASIGSNVSAAHMVAAARTVAVIPAAADEVSAGIAHLFSQHAQDYQALAGQALAFHEDFVHHLSTGAASYADIEASIASFLHNMNVSADAITNLIISDPGYLGVQLLFLPLWVLGGLFILYLLFLLIIGQGLQSLGVVLPV
jgi:hypothetical protein